MDAAGPDGLGDDGDAGLAALQETLAALDARSPWRVWRKALNRQDVCPYQARLHIPCAHADTGAALPAFLTAQEMGRVHCTTTAQQEMGERAFHHHYYGTTGGRGMEVPVFDRHGRRYDLRLKYLASSASYRLCGSVWARFMRDNQLEEAMAVMKEMGRELEVEVWAFRSPVLLPESGVEAADHHPDGALGMAILIRN